jgi:hypothetical protein
MRLEKNAGVMLLSGMPKAVFGFARDSQDKLSGWT